MGAICGGKETLLIGGTHCRSFLFFNVVVFSVLFLCFLFAVVFCDLLFLCLRAIILELHYPMLWIQQITATLINNPLCDYKFNIY